MGEDLTWIVSAVLFAWTCVLVWGSVQIHYALRGLAEERRELRRWRRLAALHQSQKVKWQ